jgi:hypothetical protein
MTTNVNDWLRMEVDKCRPIIQESRMQIEELNKILDDLKARLDGPRYFFGWAGEKSEEKRRQLQRLIQEKTENLNAIKRALAVCEDRGRELEEWIRGERRA